MGFVTSDCESATGSSDVASNSAAGPRSHRRAGPAVIDEPVPSFPKVLWENPREPALVGLGALFGLGWGASIAIRAGSGLGRGLGVAAVMAGLLLLVSYILRFIPAAFQGERWSRMPGRALRLALRSAWGVFLGAAVVACVVSLIVDH